MLFEFGMTLDYKKKYYLLTRMLTMQQTKRLKHKSLTFEDDSYTDITFDVIKRGTLLLSIGLPIASISFAIEFYSKHSIVNVASDNLNKIKEAINKEDK